MPNPQKLSDSIRKSVEESGARNFAPEPLPANVTPLEPKKTIPDYPIITAEHVITRQEKGKLCPHGLRRVSMNTPLHSYVYQWIDERTRKNGIRKNILIDAAIEFLHENTKKMGDSEFEELIYRLAMPK